MKRSREVWSSMPPVWRIRIHPLHRLCGKLTRHRWTRALTDWRKDTALGGAIPCHSHEVQCRVCGFRMVEWRSR